MCLFFLLAPGPPHPNQQVVSIPYLSIAAVHNDPIEAARLLLRCESSRGVQPDAVGTSGD